jgi:hypothetical protein
MKASWERKTGKKIIHFCVDGAGELGSDKFVKALEGMGIEQDITLRYDHWKNGKWKGSCKGSKNPRAKLIIELGTQSPQLSNYIYTDNDHYQIRMISPNTT